MVMLDAHYGCSLRMLITDAHSLMRILSDARELSPEMRPRYTRDQKQSTWEALRRVGVGRGV